MHGSASPQCTRGRAVASTIIAGQSAAVDDPDRDRLRARLAQAGYTPGRRDVAPLVALIDDDELPPTVRRALARAPAEVVTRAVVAALAGAADATGASLATVLADAASHDPGARAAVIAALADPRPRTRRAAVVGLGKLGGDDARAALCALWDQAGLDPPLRRAWPSAAWSRPRRPWPRPSQRRGSTTSGWCAPAGTPGRGRRSWPT